MIELILGGTKTGKTSYAINQAKQTSIPGNKVLYIATATHTDKEMTRRIRKHQESRPQDWSTWEEPTRIAENLIEKIQAYDAAILDCMTLLMTNWLMEEGEDPDPLTAEKNILTKVNKLLAEAKQVPIPIYIISNQVEVGLHSPYSLGRLFQDLAGVTHQRIAQQAQKVVVMHAGLPLVLKA
ncbi:bifunctional adenosylcobinamide kinase/adenosylcobinamide-phosphate guanylyltransferase [Spirochaeta cellobiosiphila]|uniref:bifunctional adenosylcobinamide kinase/adenosylcobinamide-phosphate guanylyltransferase n=1 Tax=Spirochaeta cellobiosiphila TaxID=504483 RepID=UPI00040D12B8|nr:bifunctional adenosylcobinamide kinase/adenosylcobinamide-phosphate guanylyltransferase [Spirochaeta cellobiosiphila]